MILLMAVGPGVAGTRRVMAPNAAPGTVLAARRSNGQSAR